MAGNHGGAWQTEEFDNGRGFQHPQPAPVQSPPAANGGTTPARYNTSKPLASLDSACMTFSYLGLRVAQIVFTLIGFSIVASNKIDYGDGEVVQTVKDSNFAYLLSMDVIVCLYAIVLLIFLIINLAGGRSILEAPKRGMTVILYFVDHILAYMLFSAVGAAAGLTIEACGNTSGTSYCSKAGAAVAMSLFAAICLALTAFQGYYRLYKIAT